MDCCQYNRKLAIASCGLVTLPSSRRIFDRILKTIFATDIKERISTTGYLFVVAERLVVDTSITATEDSSLMKAKGCVVWHKSAI